MVPHVATAQNATLQGESTAQQGLYLSLLPEDWSLEAEVQEV